MQQIASSSTLDQIERDLQDLSHGQEALTRIQGFSAGLKKTAVRQLLFNATGALICDPIDHQAALEAGKIPASEDEFRLLQGDLITTDVTV